MAARWQQLATWLKAGSLAGRRVLFRADLNIPILAANGLTLRDESRLTAHSASLHALHEAGARVAILSHFGRPKDTPERAFSLAPVAEKLAATIGLKIGFAADCIGPAARAGVEALKDGEILVLENTRFHLGERRNDPAFARALAAHGDVFVNDAFSVSHRAHASTLGLAGLLPSCAGLALDKELRLLHDLLHEPARPVMAICAGAKIGSKLPLLRHLCSQMDCMALGGGMAHVFLAAQGHEVGESLCEHSLIDDAKGLANLATQSGCELLLPLDVRDGAGKTWAATGMDKTANARDIGAKSVAAICAAIDKARTLIWNGPLGAFETPPSGEGTLAVARHAAGRVREGKLVCIAGGGETAAAMNVAGVYDEMTHVSTGGGAFLRWLEPHPMPVLEALRETIKEADHAVAKA